MDYTSPKIDPMKIPGWMTSRELAWLAFQAAACQSWLEVGAWCGRSTCAVITHLPIHACITVVDPFTSYLEWYKYHMPYSTWPREQFEMLLRWSRRFRPDLQVNVIETTLINAGPKLPPSVDAAFIDGDHDYEAVMEDIRICRPLVRHGGILAGHDYDNNHDGVVLAVNENFSGKVDVAEDTSIWWVKL